MPKPDETNTPPPVPLRAGTLAQVAPPTALPANPNLKPFNEGNARFFTGLLSSVAQAPVALPTLPLIAADMVAQGIKGTDEQVIPGSQWAKDTLISIDDFVRKQTNVAPPTTPVERAQEVAGSLVVPGPTGVGKVAKALAPIVPLRQSKSVAGAAVEAAIPYLLGEGSAKLAGQDNFIDRSLDALGVGNVQDAEAPSEQPEEITLGDPKTNIQQASVAPVAPPDPDEFTLGGGGDPDELTLAAPLDPFETKRRTYYAVLGGLGLIGTTIAGTTLARNLKASRKDAAARMAGGDYGGSTTKNFTRQGTASDAGISEQNSLRGPVLGMAGRVNAQVFDHQYSVLAGLERVGNAPVADKLMDRLRTSTHAALSSKADSFLKTGVLPDGTKVPHAPAELMQRFATWAPDRQGAWQQIMVIGSKLDHMEGVRRKYLASGQQTPARKLNWNGKSKTQLEADLIALRHRNPEAAQLADQFHGVFKKIPEYLYKNKMISWDDMNRMLVQNKRYAPLQREIVDGFRDRWWNWFVGKNESPLSRKGIGVNVDELLPRAKLEESIKAGDIGSIFYTVPQYLQDVIRYSEINKLRHDIGKAMSTVSVNYDGQTHSLIKFSKKAPPPGSPYSYVKVMVDGKERFMTSPDAGLINALRWAPRTVTPVLGPLVQTATRFWVGPANPFFAFGKHPFYEAPAAAMMVRRGRALGPVTRTVNNLTAWGDHIPVIREALDVLRAPVNLAAGTLETLVLGPLKYFHAKAAEKAYYNAVRSLETNTGLTSIIGPTNTRALADLMHDAYMRSTSNLAQAAGAISSSRFDVVDYGTVTDALSQVPGFMEAKGFTAKNSAAYRMYMGMYDAVHEASKLQHFGANVERELKWKSYTVSLFGRRGRLTVPVYEPVTSTDMTKLAKETRELTGAMDQYGGDVNTTMGQVNQHLASSIPFMTQSLQVMKQLAKVTKHKPLSVISSLSSVAAASMYAWSNVASSDKGRELVNDMTPEQRARFIPIMNADGELDHLMALPPELRMVTAPVVEAWLAFLGAFKSDFEFEGDSSSFMKALLSKDSARAMLGTFVNDILPDMTGPALAVPLALATGQQFQGPNQFDVAEPRQDVYGRAMDEDDKAGFMHNLWTAADGILGGAKEFWVQPYTDAYRAYNLNNKLPVANRADPFTTAVDAYFNSWAKASKEAKAVTTFGALYQVQNKASVANMTYKKLRGSQDKMTQIMSMGNRLVKQAGMGFSSGRAGNEDLEGAMPSMVGDPVFTEVFSRTMFLQKVLTHYKEQYDTLNRRIDLLNRDPYTHAGDRVRLLNKYQRDKQDINTDMLAEVRETEALISKQTGQPFNYEDFSVPEMP